MAGLATLFTYNNNRSLPRYLCPNGKFIEPLDIVHSLFPNEGRQLVHDEVCFVSKRFTFQLLLDLLPTQAKYYTPADFVDGVIGMIMMGIVVSVMMLLTRELWDYLDPAFRSINPPHKKLYVVANIAKAVLLAFLALSPRYWSGGFQFYYGNYEGIVIKRCSIIYCSSDFVALFLVPKLPRSTLLHHITTSIMVMVIVSMDLDAPDWNGALGVAKMSVIYGLFSSAAFSVNLYLALRVVYPNAKWMPILVHASLWIYILCCLLNWGAHAIWLYPIVSQWELSVVVLLYLGAVYIMVKDDIILISWLIKRIKYFDADNQIQDTCKNMADPAVPIQTTQNSN